MEAWGGGWRRRRREVGGGETKMRKEVEVKVFLSSLARSLAPSLSPSLPSSVSASPTPQRRHNTTSTALVRKFTCLFFLAISGFVFVSLKMSKSNFPLLFHHFSLSLVFDENEDDSRMSISSSLSNR